MYAAERSTFDGSLPEKAPPPWRPRPPYVSTMILRPVRPESPCGPPMTNLPVGLMWNLMSSFQYFFGITGAHFRVGFGRVVHAAGDVRGLGVERHQHAAGVRVEADVRVGVADFADRRAGDVGGLDVAAGAELAGEDDLPGRHERLTGDA